MTRVARIVLQDAKHAISQHTDMLQSEAFRASWFTVVGLLRAVGHVLAKVDAESSEAMRIAVQQTWAQLSASRPEPVIFWGFIDTERNRFLKSYEHGISRTLKVPTLLPGIYMTSDRAKSRGSQLNPGTKLKSVISTGPFAGQSERTIAWQAHDWWEHYLDGVDAIAASSGTV